MVWQVLDLLQSGLSFDDIQACLQYANAVIKHEEVRLTGATKSGHFLADECLGRPTIALLRERGHRVITLK